MLGSLQNSSFDLIKEVGEKEPSEDEIYECLSYGYGDIDLLAEYKENGYTDPKESWFALLSYFQLDIEEYKRCIDSDYTIYTTGICKEDEDFRFTINLDTKRLDFYIYGKKKKSIPLHRNLSEDYDFYNEAWDWYDMLDYTEE